MKVIFNGKTYLVVRMACGYCWQFTSTEHPRESFTMNRDQMVRAGFGDLVRGL